MFNEIKSNKSAGRFLAPRKEPLICTVFNTFFYSPLFMVWAAALCLLANIFAKEMLAYALIVITTICIIAFGRDLLAIMPLFICSYISPSSANNPGKSDGSIFLPENGGLIMIGMIVLVIIALVIRLSLDRALRESFFETPRKLWLGFVLVGAAYLLSGIGSEGYQELYKRNLLFALIQFASIAGLYFFFSGSVYWEKAPKNYFAWLGMMVGVVLLIELGYIYMTADVIVDGVITEGQIYTGWGMENNIGPLLAMMIPFPYYFASKSKKCSWFYHLLGILMVAGCFLSDSRGAIVVAVMVYFLCMAVVIWKAQKRLQNILAYVFTAILILGTAYYFREVLAKAFEQMIKVGLSSTGRELLYSEGISQFLKNPVLGASFYSIDRKYSWSTMENFITFFPSRWHNTWIQMAASCGSLGIIAYAVHRVQTAILFLKKENRTSFKLFIALSLVVFLGASLLDCHFFNIGPGLYYSMALAFAEHCPADQK